MFGRRRDEDYDRYNEEVNAKYDDDYIRDNDEYRDERRHDRGITYKNKEYRDECPHDHGITYETHDSNANVEEDYGALKAKFDKLMKEGEYVIWCGKPEKSAVLERFGVGNLGLLIPLIMIVIFTVLVFDSMESRLIGFSLQPLFYLVFIALFAKMLDRRMSIYAITNTRVLAVSMIGYSSMKLKNIGYIKSRLYANNTGDVVIRPSFGDLSGKRCQGFFNIKSPATVERILSDAVENAKKRK